MLFSVAQVKSAFAALYDVKADGSNQSESSHRVILSTQIIVLEIHQMFKTMFMHLQDIARNFVIGSLYGRSPHIFVMYAHSPIQCSYIAKSTASCFFQFLGTSFHCYK